MGEIILNINLLLFQCYVLLTTYFLREGDLERVLRAGLALGLLKILASKAFLAGADFLGEARDDYVS